VKWKGGTRRGRTTGRGGFGEGREEKRRSSLPSSRSKVPHADGLSVDGLKHQEKKRRILSHGYSAHESSSFGSFVPTRQATARLHVGRPDDG
jgi:hypothetical protein